MSVLIVDDDVRNVLALTSALEMHTLDVLYADNGLDGIALLTEHPEVRIVLMDAMVPDLDGNATTRRIRALPQWQDPPIDYLSVKAIPGDRESSLVAGASNYVTKPVDLDELLAIMASWVTGNGNPAVDDRREILLALQAILEGLPTEVLAVTNGEDALKQLLVKDYAPILLDARMPGMDGFGTARHVKQREGTRHIPILFLTAGRLRPADGFPRIPGWRGRLHHQTPRSVGPAVESVRVRRPLQAAHRARSTRYLGWSAVHLSRRRTRCVDPQSR